MIPRNVSSQKIVFFYNYFLLKVHNAWTVAVMPCCLGIPRPKPENIQKQGFRNFSNFLQGAPDFERIS